MKRVVIDTNVLIAWQKARRLIGVEKDSEVMPVYSVITQIEALGFRGLSEESERVIESYIGVGQTVGIDAEIIAETIRIRKQARIKTPDAIIAATALCQDVELWTANTDDFKHVDGLKLHNPLSE